METTNRARFGAFELDLDSGELRRGGVPVHLASQPTLLLSLLVSRAGDLITREELGRSLWRDRWRGFDQGLNTCISQIRAALGDHANSPTYVETVPRRGYRFVAPVEWLGPVRAAAAPVRSGSPGSRGVPSTAQRATPGIRTWAGAGFRNLRAIVSRPSAVAVAAVLVAVVAIAVARAGERTDTDPRVMLAVRPFADLHGDTTLTYLGVGLTEELITLLSGLDPDRLGVIARTSSAQFGADATIADVARQLGVDFVVEGAIRSDQNRLRITAQLVRVSDQSQVWAQTWDRSPGADLLDIERDVGRSVAGALALRLVPGALPLADGDSPDARPNPARHATLEGRFLLDRGQAGDAERALARFQEAIAEDSLFAPAWAGLAQAYLRVGATSVDAEQARASVERAAEAAANAVRLDDRQIDAHLVLAAHLYQREWDWSGAEFEYRRALALAPGRADVHHAWALFLAALGRDVEAKAAINEAMTLDPVSTVVLGDAAFVHYLTRDFDSAVDIARRALRIDPDNLAAHSQLLLAYSAAGRDAEALAAGLELGRVVTGSQTSTATPESFGLGDFWLEWIRWWRANAVPPVSSYQVALGFARLQQPDSAIAALQQGFALHTGLVTVAAEPAFDGLREDPRFQAIIQGLGVPVVEAPPTR